MDTILKKKKNHNRDVQKEKRMFGRRQDPQRGGKEKGHVEIPTATKKNNRIRKKGRSLTEKKGFQGWRGGGEREETG